MSRFVVFLKKHWGKLLIAVLVLGVIVWIAVPKPKVVQLQTASVERRSLERTVLATGQAVSQTDVALSFQSSGKVQRVYVKEGDHVETGQLLAELDGSAAYASLVSARGVLAQAKAAYDKVVAGSTSQQITVAQKSVDAAKVTLANAQANQNVIQSQQDVLVKNAQSALLNGGLAAVDGGVSNADPTIGGVYSGIEGQYTVRVYGAGGEVRYMVTGLETYEGRIDLSTPLPLGKRGLVLTFTSLPNSGDNWTIDVPNKNSSVYLTNLNAYQASIQTREQTVQAAKNTVLAAQASLDQAQASLEQTLAKATSADIAAARAQITSAEGQVLAAMATWNNTRILAPSAGTITKVDIKPGEQATVAQSVMVLQNVEQLHVEANVSEANIADLKVGQPVDYTFDALGLDRHVTGTVQVINPASTVISGVVNYKVTADVASLQDVKPGMTANMTVLTASKDGVLAVPSRAVLSRGDQKKVVRVVDDAVKGTYHEVEVQTGLEADGGWVEILSGVDAGQTVVTSIIQS